MFRPSQSNILQGLVSWVAYKFGILPAVLPLFGFGLCGTCRVDSSVTGPPAIQFWTATPGHGPRQAKHCPKEHRNSLASKTGPRSFKIPVGLREIPQVQSNDVVSEVESETSKRRRKPAGTHHESQHGWPDDDAWLLAWDLLRMALARNTPQPTSPRRIPKHQHGIGTFNCGPEGALR